MKEPLAPGDARRLIQRILQHGTFTFSGHAGKELAKDGLTTVDGENVLRGGVVDPPDLERETWRYRVRTANITVVVVFRSETELVVVTGWRN